MTKKRKTLPEEFEQMVKAGNLTDLQAVFDQCDINAYDRKRKGNALTFCGISEAFIRWAVVQGIDMDAEDYFGELPILHQAGYDLNNFKVLLELGADIEKRNKYHITPLYNAVIGHLVQGDVYVQKIKALIKGGADVNSLNPYLGEKITPLEGGLRYCGSVHIPAMAEVANLLIDAGAKITPTMKDSVRKIGEDFEFHRSNIYKELIPKMEKGLAHLYELFQVKPVPRRIMHDGVSPIEIKSVAEEDQFEELWSLLVPGYGHAPTVQGEIIRVIAKVRDKILHGDWRKDMKKLPQALPNYFAMGNSLSPSDYEEVVKLTKSISANSDDEVFAPLVQLALKWVMLNPIPIALNEVDYQW